MTANTPQKQARAQRVAMAIVIAVGLALGAAILTRDKAKPAGDAHGHAEEAPNADTAQPVKGPHGGKLLTHGRYGVEVTIFEQNAAPQFRLYTYLDGKPLDPALSQVQLSLARLGQAPQAFKFTPAGDHLLGDAEVVEPHSFELTLSAVHAGQTHRLGYEQVEARVTMSDAQLKAAGVALAQAGPAKIGTTLKLLGEVKYNGDRTVQVVPRLPGLVTSVRANAGDPVRKGQVLAVLSSPALADQRSELLAAQRRLGLARTTHEREKSLWEQKISPEQDVLQARAALQDAEISVQTAQQKLATLGAPSGGDLTRFELRSPIDGVVTNKRISVGEVLKDDTVVFTVSDLSRVWIEAPVSAQDLGAIATGQKATVSATSFAAQAEGHVAYISALLGEQTRTAMARIVVSNPKGLWRPGLPVSVAVLAEEHEVPVAVAAEALQALNDGTVVFGRYGSSLEARPLTLGRSDGRYVEVRDGLKAGETYAAKNSFLIKAELGKAGASHDH